ncbi:MAG: PAS domain S-box protein [Desulfobacteraceae bacterium]|nr:PAS domain S-box protein [Desulfobacteraceae bacterium]
MNLLSRFNIKEKWSSVSFRLLVAVLLCSSFLTLLASAFQLYFDYQKDLKAIELNIQLIQDSYLPAIISSVYTLNDKQVNILLEGALNIRDIEHMEIYDASGNPFKSAGNPTANKDVTKIFPLDYFTPSGKVISVGILIVSASLEGVYQRLWEKTYVILFSNMVKTFFASILILMIINHLVIRHLIKISNFANRLTLDNLYQKLTLNRKVSEATSSDELEQLVQSINKMLANIKNGTDKIESLGQAYRESELKHKEMIANISDVIVITDSNGIIKYTSLNIKKWFGWNPEDLIGSSGWVKVHPDDLERIQKEFSKLLHKENYAKSVEYKYRCKDGSYKSIKLTAVNLTKNSIINGVLMNYHDITERKQVENQLHKTTHDIKERNKELKCLYTISTFYENRDISADSFFQSIVNTIPPAWQYPEITCAQITIKKNQYKTNDFKISEWKQCSNIMVDNKKQGTVKVYYSQKMPNIDEGPFLKEERNLIDEIAERMSRYIEREQAEKKNKKLEAQLLQSQKLEAVGTLAGGIAHDFNNILSIILGYSDMLKEDSTSAISTANDIDQIIKAGNRAKDLVSQILAFSRQSKKELIPIQPGMVIKEALKMLRASIPTTIKIDHNIQKCGSIIGDPTQLHQIMINLCTNAYHAMRETGGVLRVTLEPIILEENDIKTLSLVLPPGPYLKLTISDTGDGIDKATQQKIFDPYFTTKKKGDGTGLGLAVVHGVVKSFGGHITVYSEPGEGTTFCIYFPQTSLKTKIQPDKFTEPIPTGDEHILVVDDEESIVQMEKKMLENLGYQISICTSSPEALKIFHNQPDDIALVITDMTMPDMTGIELVQKIRAIRPNIPIILCSGFSELINEEKAKYFNISKYLTKPVLKRDLATAVRKTLDEQKK